MKIHKTTSSQIRKSEYGNFELQADAGWSIFDSFIDYSSGLLVVSTQNDDESTWENLGGGARGILTQKYIIDIETQKILSPDEWRKRFDYSIQTQISADNRWKMISQRVHNAERNSDSYLEKLYEVGSDTVISESTSAAFRDKARETLLERHILDEIAKPQIKAEAAERLAREPKQYCGCCGKQVGYMPRYPRYICDTCYNLPKTDEQGRLVRFSNAGMFGGFVVYYIDEAGAIISQDDKHSSFVCYINGRAYVAQEARFGGIVIEPYEDFEDI
jgi:hypothetical protein